MPNSSDLRNFLEKYFPGRVGETAMTQFHSAFEAYLEWNPKINVISRKDVENLAERHFLHSLAIAAFVDFAPGTRILDAGTGGGFPGIPLAIFFPEVEFILADSIAKKIRVVQEVAGAAGLKNVQTVVQRVEKLDGKFDFVVSRAVADLGKFLPWVRKLVHCSGRNELKNGVLYLKGGDLSAELAPAQKRFPKLKTLALSDVFETAFFSSKYLVHIPFCE